MIGIATESRPNEEQPTTAAVAQSTSAAVIGAGAVIGIATESRHHQNFLQNSQVYAKRGRHEVMKQLGISSEQELKLFSRIMPLLRTKGGNLLDQKAIKRKTDQDTVKKSNIQAQMKKIQSLQVDVNNHKNTIGYTTWSQGYDLKRAREKEKEMEHTDKRQRAQIQAKDEEIAFLQSRCRKQTRRLYKMVVHGRALGARGDLRVPSVNLLTKDEQEEVAVNHATNRVFQHGAYTDVANNYCPGLLSKYNLSANTSRPMLFDVFKMYVSDKEQYVSTLMVMDHRLLSKKAVARASILRECNMLRVRKAKCLCVIMDGSERQKQNHEPLAETPDTRSEMTGRVVAA